MLGLGLGQLVPTEIILVPSDFCFPSYKLTL
jgi:hypothetical protein